MVEYVGAFSKYQTSGLPKSIAAERRMEQVEWVHGSVCNTIAILAP